VPTHMYKCVHNCVEAIKYNESETRSDTSAHACHAPEAQTASLLFTTLRLHMKAEALQRGRGKERKHRSSGIVPLLQDHSSLHASLVITAHT
jgi:hypothetical protein